MEEKRNQEINSEGEITIELPELTKEQIEDLIEKVSDAAIKAINRYNEDISQM
jgi:phenylpyruvate tautomerase PptA (4-oxalocrotonate tautomerase family)